MATEIHANSRAAGEQVGGPRTEGGLCAHHGAFGPLVESFTQALVEIWSGDRDKRQLDTLLSGRQIARMHRLPLGRMPRSTVRSVHVQQPTDHRIEAVACVDIAGWTVAVVQVWRVVGGAPQCVLLVPAGAGRREVRHAAA